MTPGFLKWFQPKTLRSCICWCFLVRHDSSYDLVFFFFLKLCIHTLWHTRKEHKKDCLNTPHSKALILTEKSNVASKLSVLHIKICCQNWKIMFVCMFCVCLSSSSASYCCHNYQPCLSTCFLMEQLENLCLWLQCSFYSLANNTQYESLVFRNTGTPLVSLSWTMTFVFFPLWKQLQQSILWVPAGRWGKVCGKKNTWGCGRFSRGPEDRGRPSST